MAQDPAYLALLLRPSCATIPKNFTRTVAAIMPPPTASDLLTDTMLLSDVWLFARGRWSCRAKQQHPCHFLFRQYNAASPTKPAPDIGAGFCSLSVFTVVLTGHFAKTARKLLESLQVARTDMLSFGSSRRLSTYTLHRSQCICSKQPEGFQSRWTKNQRDYHDEAWRCNKISKHRLVFAVL